MNTLYFTKLTALVTVTLFWLQPTHAQEVKPEILYDPATSQFSLSTEPALILQAKNPKAAKWGSYLWEFGDGHCLLDQKPKPNKKITYRYEKAGEYTVTVWLMPFYALNQPFLPPPKKIQATAGRRMSEPLGAAALRSAQLLDLETNAPASIVPGQAIELILSYTAPTDLPSGGHLVLFYNQEKKEVSGVERPINRINLGQVRRLSGEQIVDDPTASFLKSNLVGDEKLKNLAQNLQKSHKDHLIFKIPAMKQGEERQLCLSILADKKLESKKDKNRELSLTALWIPSLGLFDEAKVKAKLNLCILAVHDPNHIIGPRVAYFRRGFPKKLEYEIAFQNKAEGTVDDVKIELAFAKNLDRESFEVNLNSIDPPCKKCATTDNPADSLVCWTVEKTEKTTIVTLKNAGLQGRQRWYKSQRNAKGSIHFTIKSNEKRVMLTPMRARITFKGAESVGTDPTRLQWRQRSFYLRPGLIFGLNHPSVGPGEEPVPTFQRASFALGFLNAPVGNGFSWGAELGYVRHQLFRSKSTILDNVLFVENQRFDIQYLDFKATSGFQLFGVVRGFVGGGLAIPATARMEVSGGTNDQFKATSVIKYGLFQSKEPVLIFNQPLENRPTPGLSWHYGLEIGWRNDLALALQFEHRYFPFFYKKGCTTFTNFNAGLRFRLFTVGSKR